MLPGTSFKVWGMTAFNSFAKRRVSDKIKEARNRWPGKPHEDSGAHSYNTLRVSDSAPPSLLLLAPLGGYSERWRRRLIASRVALTVASLMGPPRVRADPSMSAPSSSTRTRTASWPLTFTREALRSVKRASGTILEAALSVASARTLRPWGVF